MAGDSPTDYEQALCGALMGILGQEKHALADIVAGLNDAGIKTEAGDVWTEELFETEMARLGAGTETGPIASPLAEAADPSHVPSR